MAEINFPRSKWYDDCAEDWQQMRDTYKGKKAIRKRDTLNRWRYLPPLDGMSKEAYEHYKLRAPFFGAVEITAEAFVGLVHRKDPRAEYGALSEEIVEDVTLAGQSIEDACKDVLFERLLTGFVGILIDHPQQESPQTVASAEASNLRAHWTIYEAEDIRMVMFKRENNRRVMSRVVLRETFEGMKSDGTVAELTRKRTLILEEGQYRQEIEEEDPEGGDIVSYTINVRKHGAPMSYIPFFAGPQLKGTKGPDKPPMLNLSDLSLDLYRLRADHNHGLHYAGLPTPYVTGVPDEDKPSSIGCQELWCLEDPQAKAGVLETAKDFPGHEKEAATLRSEMAQAGSRLLAPDAGGVEKTKYEASVKQMGETSVLLKLVMDGSSLVTAALRELAEWEGITETKDIEHEFNRDFLPQALTPTEALALVETWLRGAISRETMHINLQRGEIIEGDISMEDEMARIAAEPPPALDGTSGGDDDGEDRELGRQ